MFCVAEYKGLKTKHNKEINERSPKSTIEFWGVVFDFLKFSFDNAIVKMKCNFEQFCYILTML